MGDMLTLKEASNYCGYSVSYIRQKLLNGEIEGEKEDFQYGSRWLVSKEELDRMVHVAKVQKESVQVKEVNKPISKDQLMEELIEAINSQNKEVIDEAMEKVSDKLDKQNEAIETLSEEIKEIKREQNKSFWEKVKGLFT